MADNTMPIFVPSEIPIKVAKWKVKQGAFVSQGQILFLYNDSSGKNTETKKFKATRAGTISSIKVKEGDIVEVGQPLAELEGCKHPTVMKEMCAECGADLRVDEGPKRDVAIVPMVHSVPELKVSEELAQKLGREDADRLLKDRKLVLLVDLDQTLVHTTNDNIPPNLKDVLHFFLRGNPGRWCHTRLRPRTKEFLESAAKNYELHVCTFGARQYAHAIADLIDPEKKFFSHRILSRDECFDARTKSANLKALFPCGDNMVCIIDDREDVWRHASNLIHVRPYLFFQCGDINAPPPLVEDKSKLLAGKNGAQNLSNQMPTLDDVEADGKPADSNTPERILKDKESEGGNGIIVSNSEETNKKPAMVSKTNELELGDKPLDDVPEPKWVETTDGQIEIEDPDDYLIYLEDILKRIHTHFYELYDKMKDNQIPDLKSVIPEVKSEVLAGTSLVFSGLVPTHQKLETSRAYQVARSLGAEVTQDFTDKTTHLVAVRSGTAKVNASRRMVEGKKLCVVTPEWLWGCAERWERVEEKLYPLSRGGQLTGGPLQSSARRPPAHCSSPPLPAASRKRSPSEFMDTLNPLLTFSSDDIADMDREVEDIFKDTDESSSDEEQKAGDDDLDDEENPPEDRLISLENEDSSQERVQQSQEKRLSEESSDSENEGTSRPRKRPRRSSDDEPPDDDDDTSWRLMGAALEREFLAQD